MAYSRRGLIWGFTVFIWLIVYIQLFPSLLPIGHIFFDSFGHLLPHLFQHHSTNLTLFPMGYKLWEGGNCVYVFHQGHVLLIICATIFVLFSLSLHSKSNCSFRSLFLPIKDPFDGGWMPIIQCIPIHFGSICDILVDNVYWANNPSRISILAKTLFLLFWLIQDPCKGSYVFV